MLIKYLFIIIPVIINAKRRLRLSDVCEEYLRCSDELEIFERTCYSNIDARSSFLGQHDKMLGLMLEMQSSACGEELKKDYDILEDGLIRNRKEVTMCIRDSVKSISIYRFAKEKAKFCYPYMVALEMTEITNANECRLYAMKMENRCTALKQCCEPASRCEQTAIHSQSGRKVEGLREEIGIKLADCRQRDKQSLNLLQLREQTPTLNTVDNEFNEKEVMPPYELCERYLQCQKDVYEIRNRCSTLMKTAHSGSLYSWAPSYNSLSEPLDEKDEFCKKKFSSDFDQLMSKRKIAEEYLNACVPVANMTREVEEKQKPCEPNQLINLDLDFNELTANSCPYHISIHRSQCSLLRDCCVQADICERNAMYGVLADDYLLAQTELKTKMDLCYHY